MHEEKLKQFYERKLTADAGGGEEGPTGQGLQGIYRLLEGQRIEDELRHGRRGRDLTSDLPLPGLASGSEAAARSVPRFRPCAQCSPRRANRLCL